MNLANLTPIREIVVFRTDDCSDDAAMKYVQAGKVAYTKTAPQEHIDTLEDGIRVYEPQRACGINIEPDDPTVDGIIVTLMAAEYLTSCCTTDFTMTTTLDGKRDVRVFIPDTGPESSVLGADGRPRGVRRFNEYEPLDAATIRRFNAKR